MNRFGLTENDMKRLSKEGILLLIKSTQEMLSVWSISKQGRRNYEEDLVELNKLLQEAK